VAEAADRAGDRQPEAPQQGPSSRVPAIAVSLAALAIVGAATANVLPNFNFSHFALPSFNRPSLPNFNGFALPNVALPNVSWPNFSWPNFSRFTAPSPRETASVRIPDPFVSAALRDIQLSQKDIQSSEQQNASVLVSLTQSSANQQADLKRISRQLSSLATQVDALQGAMAPLTTSSIPRPKPRARVALTQRKMTPPPLLGPPPLPKPVGPVSVGGAPLSPAPVPGSG
jgi:hypothetical protein